MKSFVQLFLLPPSVLSLLANAQDVGPLRLRPRALDHRVDLVPNHGRELQEQTRPTWQAPVGVRKMGEDEGEKFWPHFWDFGDEPATSLQEEALLWANISLGHVPIAQHSKHDGNWMLYGRSIFTRAFQCPANTTACPNTNLCCPNGETCVATSSGGTCCCPAGQTCTVDTCSGCASGYTACTNSPDGGCCVPGAVCATSGCLFVGTQTTVVTLPTATVTTTITSSSLAPDTTTSTTSSQTSVSVSTVTVTQIISGAPTTVLVPTTIVASTSPINATTTTVTPVAPILATSVSTSVGSVSAASVGSTTITTSGTCPTGYYMCSAYYLGGCCRVGRNCDTTSCPSTDSTAVISSEATIVVPTTITTTGGGGAAAAATGTQGGCANGWYLCPSSASGGCCPSGFVCGTASCSATISGESNTGKEAPSQASTLGWAWSFLAVAVVSAVGMALL